MLFHISLSSILRDCQELLTKNRNNQPPATGSSSNLVEEEEEQQQQQHHQQQQHQQQQQQQPVDVTDNEGHQVLVEVEHSAEEQSHQLTVNVMGSVAEVKQRVCLIVIDGWGLSEEKHGNAIANAKTPVMDGLCSGNWSQLEAHGLHVGLPEGLMGNSEVGHLNIGAGRVVYQDIVRINLAIKNDKIVSNENVVKLADNVKANNGRLHFMGLISDGGVHSHIDHLFALVKAAKRLGVPKTFVHFFGDGRDTSPTSGVGFLQQTLDFLRNEQYGQLATIVGRYYAMDRDKRWERLQVAYEAMVGGKGEKTNLDNVVDVVKQRYAKDETDEFLKPIIVNEEGLIKDNDTLVFFDYRADRMRQIAETMGIQRHFETDVKHPAQLHISGMTQYKAEFPFASLFPPVSMKNVLGEWLATQGLTQFHCAETEKYAHVTFFFNGGVEQQFPNEERCLVPSPKGYATYDLIPPMSAAGVAEKMVEQIKLKHHPFVMCNFAPPDMVGHTGIYEAAVTACEATDVAIGQIFEACKANDYVLMVTSDHGNAEKMIAADGGKHTAHTCYKVPFTNSSTARLFKKSLPDNRAFALCDVAPTVLDIMGLPIPKEMDGASIVD